MRITKTLLSIAVATSLGAVSLTASAAGPTVYGDLSYALVRTASASGGDATIALSDNVSLLGVKGEAAAMGKTKYVYDFNFILDGGSPATHLATIGAEGDFGSAHVGMRENGLFCEYVDCGTYQTNWFYTTGMSSLQVNQAITYKSMDFGGFKFGVQAFDINKQVESTMNLTLGGTFAKGPMSFGVGYTNYSEYGDMTSTTKYGANGDGNQMGGTSNSFSSVVLKNVLGVTGSYTMDKFGVTGAVDLRKPNDGNTNTSSIRTVMVTGSFAATSKLNLVANISSTDQSGTAGKKGNVLMLMAGFAPVDNVSFTLELQNCNSDANNTGLEGCVGGGSDSTTSMAVAGAYSF